MFFEAQLLCFMCTDDDDDDSAFSSSVPFFCRAAGWKNLLLLCRLYNLMFIKSCSTKYEYDERETEIEDQEFKHL